MSSSLSSIFKISFRTSSIPSKSSDLEPDRLESHVCPGPFRSFSAHGAPRPSGPPRPPGLGFPRASALHSPLTNAEKEQREKNSFCRICGSLDHWKISCPRIKWKGYPDSENSWEALANISACSLIKEFH